MNTAMGHLHYTHEVISIFFDGNEALVLCQRSGCNSIYNLHPDHYLNFCLFAEACLEYNTPPSQSWEADIFTGTFTPLQKRD
jgi:hypothetical protein